MQTAFISQDSLGRFRLPFYVVMVCLLLTPFLHGQGLPPVTLPVETLQVELDSAAQKQIAALIDLMQGGVYPEAVAQLRRLSDLRSDKFVPVTKTRFVTPGTYADMLAGRLPPEALKLYREQIDAVARPQFEAARANRNSESLRRVVQLGYAGSFADDAINLLAEIAWEEGNIPRARGLWEQLIPTPVKQGWTAPVVLSYPQTDLDLASIRARLILCSIFLGEFSRAERELGAYKRLHPQAEGMLGGNKGTWSQLLEANLQSARGWQVPPELSKSRTFAGSPQRNDCADEFSDALRSGWTVEWNGVLPLFRGKRPPPLKEWSLAYFPVIDGHRVFWQDDEAVYGCDLHTGKPLWPVDENTDYHIYQSPLVPAPINRDELKEDPSRFREILMAEEGRPFAGGPQFTLSVGNGRLISRLRSRTQHSQFRVGDGEPGRLVCLDVRSGEGKLLWQQESSEWKHENLKWLFEGSPVLDHDRCFVSVRSDGPQRWVALAALDLQTGKPVWFRKLGLLQTQVITPHERLSRALVTVEGDRVYYHTGTGSVGALNAETGACLWISQSPVNTVSERAPEPAQLRWDRGAYVVFERGSLFSVTPSSALITAWDAETGLIRWIRPLAGTPQDILGADARSLIVSGTGLWGIAPESGRLLWQIDGRDAELQSFGRGIVSRGQILWPTREELFCLDRLTGSIHRRFPLQSVWNLHGGNLISSNGMLLIAQQNKLSALRFGPASAPSSELTTTTPAAR